MTLVRFPGALKEFGGASPAFRLPIQTSASTTWLGEEMTKQEERAEAMAFQIDGWTEGQEVLTKEEVFALNKRMILASDPMASDKQLWLGTPDRLHQLNVQDIGGIMTLSVFQSKYLGDQPKPEDPLATHEQTVIICSARPSGTKDGSKFLLRSDEHLADSDSNNSDTQRFKPSGFPIPKAVNPILAAASCQTRAPRNAKIDEWYKAISSDHILFPRGDEVMQPVVLVFHQDEAPPDDAMEACILGGKGTLTATMQEPLLYPHGETALLAYATDSDLTPESTWLAPMGRCFFLPKNHGVPLAVGFNPGTCRSGAELRSHCVAFTGLDEEVYTWMIDNPLLDMWLTGCRVSPALLRVDTVFMSQATETWSDFKSLHTRASFDTFNHPDLVLRSRLLWDHLLHTLEGTWPEKLKQLGAHALTIFDRSPDIARFHTSRIDDMWYLPALINVKTNSWVKHFEIQFQKTELPTLLEEYARVDITASLSAEDLSQLCWDPRFGRRTKQH